MPSKSPEQKRFMAAVANNPKFAKKVGVPSKVGKEFEMEDKKMVKKELAFMKAKGAPKSMIKHEKAEAKAMKKGTKKYAAGGLAAGHKSADGIAKKGKTKGMMPKMAKGGKTKGCM